MMMTAGSLVNAEPFKHAHTTTSEPLCDMSYRFISSGSPLFRHSSSEAGNEVNDNNQPRHKPALKRKSEESISDPSLAFHPAARGGFILNSFAYDAIQSMHRGQSNQSHDIVPNTLPKISDPHRRSPETQPTRPPSGSVPHGSRSFFDNDEDDSWKVCGVCNDKATGYHFNALTCEGCKGFFRRSVKNSKTFTCTYNNQCSITKSNRRQCQACRLRKCIQIGMKRECIMSPDEIQMKKTLVLSNRIKRATMQWVPMELTNDQKILLDTICSAFIQSNNLPEKGVIRGGEEVRQDADKGSPCSSPSSSSNNSNFLELIKRIANDIAARTPSNMTNPAHVVHFTDIMEFSIKEIIKFCKKIPTFMDLDLKDQIALLKSGCTEILFIKANYTYDLEKKALTLGPDILYTRDSFLQGGMSVEYTDNYLKFHEDLSALQLDDVEMSSLSAIALFSADRADLVDQQRVENQQEALALCLQAYSESSWKVRNRFAIIMSFLPRLRTLNSLCTTAFSQVKKQFGEEIRPLVKEVQPTVENA
uniref:Nuclear receptor n=1 Tax=Ciona intestinalis TaxID=7719 RepID=Q4H2N0_CIOIN|nr:nuclear receptor [Ciona intestinalis]BAE06747.1 nuclear receptor [Ciona intestinalis]|eukprot:NP_001071847.1 nuclear receptor [Ciona intestinalis]